LISSDIFLILKFEVSKGGKAFKVDFSLVLVGLSFSWLTVVESSFGSLGAAGFYFNSSVEVAFFFTSLVSSVLTGGAVEVASFLTSSESSVFAGGAVEVASFSTSPDPSSLTVGVTGSDSGS